MLPLTSLLSILFNNNLLDKSPGKNNGVEHALNIKIGKYSERCKAEGIVFIPLVVDRFGGWYKDAVEVITQAGEAHGEGGGGDNNEERMEQLLQRVVNCGARQCALS